MTDQATKLATYSNWESVPSHLKTRSALKKMGLRPRRGQKRVAIKTHWHWKTPDYDLYDLNRCVPNIISDKQRAALDKAKQQSLESRTCHRCGWVQELSRHYRGKQYLQGGHCPNCWDDIRRKSDRAEAIEWAGETLKQEGVLILDSETTDFEGEIIELAVINLQGETLYNRRFKPSLEIHPGATAAHGIKAEDLANEPTFESEYAAIRDLLASAKLVLIYNADFDYHALLRTCRLYNCETLIFEHDCLMEWYAAYCNQWSYHHRSYRWQPLNGDHSALGDCRAALAVLKEMSEADKEDSVR